MEPASDKTDLSPHQVFHSVFAYLGQGASIFIIFSGIIFSSLGVTDYINPTVWLLSALAAMLVIYGLREYVFDNFLPVLVACVSIIIVLLLLEGYIQIIQNLEPFDNAKLNQKIQRFSLFFMINFFVAYIFASYRKHSFKIQSPLPTEIQETTRQCVSHVPMYYERFDYKIDIYYDERNRHVRHEMTVDFLINNISGSTQNLTSRYPIKGDAHNLTAVYVDDKAVDIDQPQYFNDTEIIVPVSIQPKTTRRIFVSLSLVFHERDSDFFTVFDYPCRYFNITVNNHTETLDVWLDQSNMAPESPRREGGTLDLPRAIALLPYQGFVLLWRLKRDNVK